ncbi:unnamed protein product [Rodentolepis nana]|uniref:SAP domain-containing protein n=1 Tax=Rodentolepis nana TaxID=102285 RepID=A0A0R3TI14_RODNA|nr:unnamed protein product [Rodentolepis nana]VDO02919.1 unnamed protein product [Rodentolepis nana]
MPALIRDALEEEKSSGSKTLLSSKLGEIEDLEGPDAVETLTKRLRKVKINVAMEFGDSSNPPKEWERTNERPVDSRSRTMMK